MWLGYSQREAKAAARDSQGQLVTQDCVGHVRGLGL